MVTTYEVSPVLGTRDVRALAGYLVDEHGFTCDPENGMYDGIRVRGCRRTRSSCAAMLASTCRSGASEFWPGEREDIEGDVYVFVDDAYTLFEE